MRDADLADFLEGDAPPERSRFRWWIILAGVVLGLWVAASVGTTIYTDLLWFREVGYVGVFWTILGSRVVLFALGAALFAVFLSVNVYLARRLSPKEGVSLPPNIPPEAIVWLRQLMGLALLIGTVVLAIIFGLAASGAWESALRFWNSLPFGLEDPLFHRDVSYYVFSLPLYRFIQGWLIAAAAVSALASVGIYAANFSLSGFQFGLTPAIRGHLSGLGALFLLLIALGYWFDINELVYSTRGAAFGAGYADVHAQLLALRLLIVVAVAVAGALLFNIFWQSIRLPLIAVGVWAVVLVLGAGVYPALVQRFQVEPNEFQREQQFIEYTIDMTRKAYALDRIQVSLHNVEGGVTAEDIISHPLTINNLRLWDYRPLRSIYKQIQFFELYYDFNDIDVDRYVVDGDYRQVLLGVRELTGPPPEARTWVNQTLQYTHGYGLAASPATEFRENGDPEFLIKDIPPVGSIPVTQPQVYYGELTDNYILVGTEVPELDHPSETGPVYQSYEGTAGIPIGSPLNRLLFSWRFGDLNLLITDAITPASRLLFQRQIQDRVRKIVPFLFLDRDPYMVVDDTGRLYWIQDGYTRTNRFPYSDPISPNVNYVRNSVKAVIDAYNGTVDFYIADATDGMVQTYSAIFPDLFKPLSEMPESLRAHLRYPQDFFETQALMYLRYHMTDAQVFYNKEDLWETPRETFAGETVPMEPYYVMMRLPGEDREEFVLILPFTPFDKKNMAGWLAARNDGERYGTLHAFTFRTQGRVGQIDGPEQVEAAIAGDQDIAAQFTLWRGSGGGAQEGAEVIQGNLLVIPIGGNSIIYAEPIYIRPRNLDKPSLQAVVLVTPGQKPVIAPTLDQALSKLVGLEVRTGRPGGEPSTGPPVDEVFRQRLQERISVLEGVISSLREQLDELAKALGDLADLAKGEVPDQ